MSLINETLHNLSNKKREEVVINPAGGVGVRGNSYEQTKSPHYFLILLISFCIIVTLFYITYNLQVDNYFKTAKAYFSRNFSEIASKPKNTNNKIAKAAPLKDRKETITVSAAVQAQYYRALDLLNEGKAEQAREDLKAILEEYPDFTPAKQAISMLNSR